jgi:hypothetical protein
MGDAFESARADQAALPAVIDRLRGQLERSAVQESALFRSLAAQNPSVEVRTDQAFTEGAWSYYWIVSRFGDGGVRQLAYVRTGGGQLERRIYDPAGQEMWVATD